MMRAPRYAPAWARLILLFAITGCTKQTPVSSVAETPSNEPVVVCPKFYISSEDTDTYRRWDDDIANGVRCSDGRIYCFGDNQKPELIPENSEGYECKPIGGYGDENRFKYEPDIVSQKLMSEETDIVEQYPFCDNGSTYRDLVKISFGDIHSQYAWECQDKECICGGKPCRFGSQCYHEQCIESKYKWIFDGDQNTYDYEIENEKSHDACNQSFGDWYAEYIYYRSQMTDADEADERSDSMYKCGDIWFKKKSNITCLPHPKGDIIKFDFCPQLTEEEWERYKTEKEQFEAEHPKEMMMAQILGLTSSVSTENGLGNKTAQWDIGFNPCICGNEICAEDTGCYQNRCVDLANLKPLPEGFVWKQGRPYCDKENCLCENEHCHHGEWCIEGKCFDTRDVMKVDDKYIQYGLYEYSEPIQINHYFDEDTDQALPRDHYLKMDYLPWLDIVTHRNTALCDDPVLPENIEDYKCIVAHIDNGCSEGFVDSYAFYGYHCIKDEGCDCGANHCTKNARCYHGRCIYDSVYTAMSCGHDITGWGMNAKADDNGWCVCGVSHIPPNQEGYLCETYQPNGMQCRLNSGCTCGDKTCLRGEYCVVPGKCMDEDQLNEWFEKVEECTGYGENDCPCGDGYCDYLQYCVPPGRCTDRNEMLDYVRTMIEKEL